MTMVPRDKVLYKPREIPILTKILDLKYLF